MIRTHRNTVKKTNKRRIQTSKQVVNAVRPGTASRPPDNSGMVQIPRPIASRNQVVKRTFKADYTLNSGASAFVFFSASLYAPFYTANGTSTYSSAPPPTLTNMYASFGLYKVKQIQAILEPLTIATTVPYPYTIAMVFDIASPPSSTTTATLTDYQNSTKVSPSNPTEIRYSVPKVAASGNTTNGLVLQGGWLDSTIGTAPGNYGHLVLVQANPSTASTNYSILTLVYEIWFKNPN